MTQGLVRTFVVVCFPFGAGYYLSYLYRSINAVISDALTREIGLTAEDLGLLTAVYFLAFALFQLPLGILLDRFGPRRVQSAVLLAAAIGALVFAHGESGQALVLGRALIGIGVAGGLMASFKVITLWFPAERWPLVNGLFMAIGGLGAMSATTPVQTLLGVTDWRTVFQGLALITFVVAVSIFLIVPERHAQGRRPARLAEQIRGLGAIYRDRLFWRLAPVACVSMGSGLAIQGLWAGPWLRDIAGLDPSGVARHLLVLTIGLTAGFAATGVITDLLGRRGVDKLSVVGIGAVIMLVILGLLILEVHPRGFWVWAVFGFFSNLTVVAFPALSEHFTAEYAGRCNTALNLLLFMSAFAFQYLIGWVIDLFPPGPGGGYDPRGYLAAFECIEALLLLSFLWYLVPQRRDRAAAQRPA